MEMLRCDVSSRINNLFFFFSRVVFRLLSNLLFVPNRFDFQTLEFQFKKKNGSIGFLSLVVTNVCETPEKCFKNNVDVATEVQVSFTNVSLFATQFYSTLLA